MSSRVPLAALAAFAFGCASGGGANDLMLVPVYDSDLRPVPVYDSTDELPCEYEVIRSLHTESPRTAMARKRFGFMGGDPQSDFVRSCKTPGRKIRHRANTKVNREENP